jgi:hypothetical protein
VRTVPSGFTTTRSRLIGPVSSIIFLRFLRLVPGENFPPILPPLVAQCRETMHGTCRYERVSIRSSSRR